MDKVEKLKQIGREMAFKLKSSGSEVLKLRKLEETHKIEQNALKSALREKDRTISGMANELKKLNKLVAEKDKASKGVRNESGKLEKNAEEKQIMREREKETKVFKNKIHQLEVMNEKISKTAKLLHSSVSSSKKEIQKLKADRVILEKKVREMEAQIKKAS